MKRVEVIGGPHDGKIIDVADTARALSIVEDVGPLLPRNPPGLITVRSAVYPIRWTDRGWRVFWRERRIW